MRFIENSDLREWVKENLRKTIFQKAHILAVQTGCEILIKLEDKDDITGNQYYATSHLQQVYRHGGLCEKPGESLVSGETGMPVTPKVDMAVQSAVATVPDPGGAKMLRSDSGGFGQENLIKPKPLIECPTRSVSKHKSPAKRNDLDEAEASSQDTPEYASSASAKRIKTHHRKKATPTSSGGEANVGSAGESPFSSNLGDKDKISASPGSFPSASPTAQFQCHICGKKLKSARSLKKHAKTLHIEEQFALSSTHDVLVDAEIAARTTQLDDTPAFTQISPERYPCQKCDDIFDCPEHLDAHMKHYHKKLFKHKPEPNITSPKNSPSPRKKQTPKRDNLTPRRDDHIPWGDDSSVRRDKHTSKRDLTPKRDNLTPKHDNYTSRHEYTGRHENHTPKHDLTPKRDHTPKHDHTPRHEHTPNHDLTPKHDPPPKCDQTPKYDVTPGHNLVDLSTPSLPFLGLSPQHTQSFDRMSPAAPSSRCSSPLSLPKTPGEIMPSQFSFDNDTHTSIADLPGSPPASHSSGSEPSRPNTPGETPMQSYEFSEEIKASIMNISLMSTSKLIQDSPENPVFTPPRSARTHSYGLSSPELSYHKKKVIRRGSDFKAAILCTPGPIVTTLSLQKNGPQSVKHISRIQFESAVQGLQIANFGYVVPLNVKDIAVLVFVKKSPKEIQDVWNEKAADLSLCTLEEYQDTYNMPAPLDISEHVKGQLIEQGHVTKEQMNGKNVYSNRYTMS